MIVCAITVPKDCSRHFWHFVCLKKFFENIHFWGFSESLITNMTIVFWSVAYLSSYDNFYQEIKWKMQKNGFLFLAKVPILYFDKYASDRKNNVVFVISDPKNLRPQKFIFSTKNFSKKIFCLLVGGTWWLGDLKQQRCPWMA